MYKNLSSRALRQTVCLPFVSSVSGDKGRQRETKEDKGRQRETKGDKGGQRETKGDKGRQRETKGDKRETNGRQRETKGDKWRQTETNGQKGDKLEEPHKSKIAKNISLCLRDLSRTGNATFRRVSLVVGSIINSSPLSQPIINLP